MALLAIQLSVSAFATMTLCLDRPHTHGGVPAPDCLMHQSQPDSTAPEAHHGHHHQHGDDTATDAARFTCSCSSDPITLLTTEIAVIPGGVAIQTPFLGTGNVSEQPMSVPDMRLAPLSPPPKPSFS
jgi:hypothetical protein